MKKEFENPIIDIVNINNEDIITTSIVETQSWIWGEGSADETWEEETE